MPSRLDPLQETIIDVLSSVDAGWTLSGGAALAGFHLAHRTTEDLDLFFHGRRDLDNAPRLVEDALVRAGLGVEVLQRSPGFVRLRVERNGQVVVVDLVAEPVPTVETPIEVRPGVRVDTPHEILVNKLCALVSRAELRDLEDVRVLLARGGDLERALADAARKDGGFSPMTLAWLLPQLPLARASELGFDDGALAAFRDDLVAHLTRD